MAQSIVSKHVKALSLSPEHVVQLTDMKSMLTTLRQHSIKTAICTSDSRKGTVQALAVLDVLHLLDVIVCGDDPGRLPKPHPDNAEFICKELHVSPEETVMIGDTSTDIAFAKNANLGLCIGVLSGIGQQNGLEETWLKQSEIEGKSNLNEVKSYHSKPKLHIVPSVGHILPIVLPDLNLSIRQILLGNNVLHQKLSNQKFKLVIIDKDGSFINVHPRWAEWCEKVYIRLSEKTSPDLACTFLNILGYSSETRKISNGILAEGSTVFIEECLRYLLILKGYGVKESDQIVNQIWICPSSIPGITISDTVETVKKLREIGLQVAINSSDSRKACNDFLLNLKLHDYINIIVSAEDAGCHPKPLPHTVLQIIDKVGHQYYHKHIAKRLFKTSCSVSNHKTPIAKSNDFRNSYEYIIIGAGSAGCVLANRLSLPHPKTKNSSKVLVLEAGPTDVGISRWTIKMPAALMYNLYHDKYNWYYHTVPQRHMNDRTMYWPRGRVLGGSSSLNAMVYIRGHPLDYDRWELEGADGWNYANCLPYFRKAQTHELNGNQYRGSNGPLYVSRAKTNHPLHSAWIEAGKQAGYPFTDDVNGYQQEGMGYFDMTIKNGERCSASTAYLHPAMKSSSNLTVETNALVTQILFENKRAVGVKYSKNGQVHEARAESEVILSGGAINSPHLLMLSGIGNVDYLRSIGIDAWHHLPGVGQNLQDHLELYVQQACKKIAYISENRFTIITISFDAHNSMKTQPITLYKAQWKYPHIMVGIGLKWILFRRGWAATTHLESGGFFHFLPSTIHDHGRKMGGQHAFQVHVGPMRSRSRGQILLSPASLGFAPKIDPNYLACETDRAEMRAAIRLSREIFAQPALAKEFAGKELAPGEDKVSNSQLDEFVRSFGDSAYHPSCTCRMGKNPDGRKAVSDDEIHNGYLGNGRIEAAVTQSNCKVWGIDNLRIVDASIMPSIVSGNLNAPVIMMAEKAADIIVSSRDGVSVVLPADSNPSYWKPEHPGKQRDGVPLVSHHLI
ncbi:choline dehydrogenase [Schistosoma bovis]|uniref:Choline dehydrogenase n=1 Tax=Schistosoma bovis TaxID=6184 RepID=A0A430QPT1_SCHBO|nr:choline dehydrogenase [Schistosoma bovis]